MIKVCRLALVALVVWLAACSATLTPAPAPSSLPADVSPTASGSAPDSGLIAFYSDRDGNTEIYVMNADGSEQRRVTNDAGADDSPAISPDGSRIAFLTSRHDPDPQFPNLKYELYIVDVDGSHRQRLTSTDAAEDHPAWSPDGERISFDADYDGDGWAEIYTIAPDGSGLTRLTDNSANDQFADWSPDGTQIAFTSDRNGNWDLFVMDANGDNQLPVTASPNWELFPAWSPDGTRIALISMVPGSRNSDVSVIDAAGGDLRQLTDSPAFDENPVWSPDGALIAFQTERDHHFEIYTMRPDGSDQRPLTENPADDLWPSWAATAP